MLFKQKLLESIEPQRSFLVTTSESKFMLYWVDDVFYARKTTGLDNRYALVMTLNGKKWYKEKDLDIGAEFEYVHPRLGRIVSGGRVHHITIR